MTQRVSERLAHHTRKITSHIKQHAKKMARRVHTRARNSDPRELIALAIVIILITAIFAGYFIERHAVDKQTVTQPVRCKTLMFTANSIRCEEQLLAIIGTLPPNDRDIVCNRTIHREEFGTVIQSLCKGYDDALRESRYEAPLLERGVSIWEPDQNILTNGTMEIMTNAQVSSVALVCGNKVIPTTYAVVTSKSARDLERGTLTLIDKNTPLNTTCVIIAVGQEGSMTSKSFQLTVWPNPLK